MVITIEQLLDKYNDYADPKGKISRDVKNGKLFPVVRGLYETDSHTDGALLAQFIYAPSYLSFDYALYIYDLIPERVYAYTCATFEKRRSKEYKTLFGTYTYRDIPSKVFPLSTIYKREGTYAYCIATPEKAVCDKLYTISPVKSMKNLKFLLFEDLRIDEEDLLSLNKEEILKIAPLYRSTNLDLFAKFATKYM